MPEGCSGEGLVSPSMTAIWGSGPDGQWRTLETSAYQAQDREHLRDQVWRVGGGRLEAYWESLRALRTSLQSEVKALARLRHPPRPSRRQQAKYIRQAIAAKLRRKPVRPRPSEVKAGDTEIAVALRTGKGQASPWHG